MNRIARIFKALSDETRLTILGLVFRHGHLCVCEVERILGITQSKASRHLRYLRDAGVLEDAREGLIVNYRIPEDPDETLATLLPTLRSALASPEIPEAGPLLVRIRAERGSIRQQGPRPRAEERSLSQQAANPRAEEGSLSVKGGHP